MVLALDGKLLIQDIVDALSLGGLYGLLALGIALIFGVMRLVNFAHGELIMIGGFSLYALADVPLGPRLLCAVLIVIGAALLMERFAFRPLRSAGPATLLVASFAISVGVQNIVFMIDGARPKAVLVSKQLSSSFDIGGVAISRLDIVMLAATLVLLAALTTFLRRTPIGIQMRAAAEDFQVARFLGVRANTVVALAFGLSGLLAGVASILLVSQTGQVYTTMGLTPVLLAFVATIVGGLGSLLGAVVGGLVLGILTVTLQVALPAELKPFRDAFVFGAVLLILVFRPQGFIVSRAYAGSADRTQGGYVPSWSSVLPRRRRRRRSWRAGDEENPQTVASPLAWAQGRREQLQAWSTPVVLSALVAATVLLGSLGDGPLDQVVLQAGVYLIMVIGLYMFIGLSGVFSFGHMAFALLGAYGASVLVMDPTIKETLLPSLPNFLQAASVPWYAAVPIGGVVGAVVALIIAVPVIRLSGLTAALATFAVLLIANVVGNNWDAVTGGVSGLAPVPVHTTKFTVIVCAVVAIAIAFVFQRSRVGALLKASREDEVAARSVGVRVTYERGLAFVISGFIVGIAGALQAQLLGLMTPNLFFLNTTFIVLTMLVVGGMTSLSGAVVGAIVVSVIQELLHRVEGGVDLGIFNLHAPAGLAQVGMALIVILTLILRPDGLLAGRELRLPLRSRWGASDPVTRTPAAEAAGSGSGLQPNGLASEGRESH